MCLLQLVCISVLGSHVSRAWYPQGPEITVLVSSALDSVHGNSSLVLRICWVCRGFGCEMIEKRPSYACCWSLQFMQNRAGSALSLFALSLWQPSFSKVYACLLVYVCIFTFTINRHQLCGVLQKCFIMHGVNGRKRPLKKFETPSYLFWSIIYSLWIFLFVTYSYSFRAYV